MSVGFTLENIRDFACVETESREISLFYRDSSLLSVYTSSANTLWRCAARNPVYGSRDSSRRRFLTGCSTLIAVHGIREYTQWHRVLLICFIDKYRGITLLLSRFKPMIFLPNIFNSVLYKNIFYLKVCSLKTCGIFIAFNVWKNYCYLFAMAGGGRNFKRPIFRNWKTTNVESYERSYYSISFIYEIIFSFFLKLFRLKFCFFFPPN